MPEVTVQVKQIDATASLGTARQHQVNIDRPVAKEGTDTGAMGGELLLVSLGGCFISNLLAAIRAREAAVSNIDIQITGTLDSAPPRFSAVHMQITADYEDRALMEKLVTISERGCIVANTLKNAVDLSITID
ncbi:MAG: OsmC family protein [Anaerolineae bacterium]|nr:OsmC family protein [Anaerolineae bacterium]